MSRRHRRSRRRNRSADNLRRNFHRKAKRFAPPGLAGRIILFVVGILVLVQFVGWIFGDDDTWRVGDPEEVAAEQVIATVQLLDKTPSADREEITKALSGIFLRVTVDDEPRVSSSRDRFVRELREEVEELVEELGNRSIRLGVRGDWEGIIVLSIQLKDGDWVIFQFPMRTFTLFQRERSGIWTVLGWLLVIGAVFWFSNRLARPLRTFADAAERLGRDVNVPPLPVSGSREIRRAAMAFNNMQTRVQRMVDDRSLMLAAIAHDLRTVLTRLRLRAEFIEDTEQQDKAAADIEEMQAMLDAGLAFARGETEVEDRRMTDLAVLVRGLAEDFSHTDGPATYTGPEHLSYRCGPTEMKRALSNIIRNAITYGSRADIRLANEPNGVTITVSDNGPGISQELQEQVFQPFFRVEGSRNRETGGTGLGLAIARTIARRHGGDITLKNGVETGLIATLTLPSAAT
jgi:signal transduction histidine kinase